MPKERSLSVSGVTNEAFTIYSTNELNIDINTRGSDNSKPGGNT